MKKLISEQLVKYLEDRDTKYVFGLCGHTVIAMLDALEKSKKLSYISVRHEQIASTAADGYARATGKASVVMCHLGPGLTNATTGVANAQADSIPMVVIAGDVPSYYYGKHPHQEVNLHADGSQYEIYKPFVKRAYRIDTPELFPEILDRAFRLAESGRPGPVLISVPMDMFSRELDNRYFERVKNNNLETIKPSLERETAKKIAKLLVEAKNPVIHVGGGVLLSKATDELKELVEYLEIPVSRTLMGQGALSDRHPLMLGMTGFWGTDFINNKTSNADVILGLGTRFAEADSSSWYKGVTFNEDKTKFIQIDIAEEEIGRNYPLEIGAVADIKLALQEIIKAVKELAKKEELANFAITLRINYDNETLENLNELLNDLEGVDKTKLHVHFERVWQTAGSADNEQQTLLLNALRKFTEKGFVVDQGSFRQKNYSCPAESYNYAIINHDGTVHKCNGRTLTEESACGKIASTGQIEWDNNKIAKRTGLATFENPFCTKCKMLPLCMGPCSQKLMEMGGFDNQICSMKSIDTNLNDYILQDFRAKCLIQQYQTNGSVL